jgi:hypothetical protein
MRTHVADVRLQFQETARRASKELEVERYSAFHAWTEYETGQSLLCQESENETVEDQNVNSRREKSPKIKLTSL